jgi:hypothetical protein
VTRLSGQEVWKDGNQERAGMGLSEPSVGLGELVRRPGCFSSSAPGNVFISLISSRSLNQNSSGLGEREAGGT